MTKLMKCITGSSAHNIADSRVLCHIHHFLDAALSYLPNMASHARQATVGAGQQLAYTAHLV